MSPETLILAALVLPLLIAAGIAVMGWSPNLREGGCEPAPKRLRGGSTRTPGWVTKLLLSMKKMSSNSTMSTSAVRSMGPRRGWKRRCSRMVGATVAWRTGAAMAAGC